HPPCPAPRRTPSADAALTRAAVVSYHQPRNISRHAPFAIQRPGARRARHSANDHPKGGLMSHTNDKRRHPRVAHRIRVQSSSHEAVELETIDLSAGGLSCSTPAFLPLMTKLAVSMVLPEMRPAGTDGDGHGTINGEAVVVRTAPAAPTDGQTSYRVALFFSRMDDEDRRRLHEFLARQPARGSH